MQCGDWENLFCGESGCCECLRGKENKLGYCTGTKNSDSDQQCECTLVCDGKGLNCDIVCPKNCGKVNMAGYTAGRSL